MALISDGILTGSDEYGNYVLAVGALTPQKGYRFLVRAIAAVPPEVRPAWLILSNVNNATEEASARASATQLSVELSVRSALDQSTLLSTIEKPRPSSIRRSWRPMGWRLWRPWLAESRSWPSEKAACVSRSSMGPPGAWSKETRALSLKRSAGYWATLGCAAAWEMPGAGRSSRSGLGRSRVTSSTLPCEKSRAGAQMNKAKNTIRNLFGIRGRIRLRARTRGLARRILSLIPGLAGARNCITSSASGWTRGTARLLGGQFWNDDIEALLRPLGEWPAEHRRQPAGLRDNPAVGGPRPRPAHPQRSTDREHPTSSSARRSWTSARRGLLSGGQRCPNRDRHRATGREFAAHQLLLPSDNVIYLPVAAEDLPLLNESVDIVVSRNNLDHVTDPAAVVREVYRILRPGGTFILIVHLEPEASVTEPHAFAADDIRSLTRQFTTVRETIYHGGRTETADTLAGVYRKPENDK